MATSIKNWYESSGIRVPAYFGVAALNFAKETTGIVRSVVDNRLAIVFVADLFKKCGGIGYADHKAKVIGIDASLLSENESGRDTRQQLAGRDISVTEALSIVHGTVVHEALHFLLTPADAVAKFQKVAGVPANKLFASVMNLVEDVYIENYGINEFPELGWMIAEYWDVFLPESHLTGIQKTWGGEAPTTNEELQAAVNTLVCFKNQTGRHNLRTAFEERMREIIYSVRSTGTVEERGTVMGELYRHLIQNMPKNEEGEGEEKDGEKQKGEGAADQSEEQEEGEGQGQGDGETTPENVDEGNLDVELPTKEVPHFIMDEENKNAGSEIRKQRNSRFTFENLSPSNAGVTLVTRFSGKSGATINYDSHWNDFAKAANTNASARSVTGPARYSGNRLSHAENLFTTDPNRYGKVWSKGQIESKQGVAAKGKARVVVLVDCSGSMGSFTRGHRDEKIDEAISAAYGAVCGFEKAGIPIAVYGFTTKQATNLTSGEVSHMIIFKEFEDSYRTGKEALASAYCNMSGNMVNNPDSVAIEFATKKLVAATGTKVMIVISDGEPHAWVYRGTQDATEETKKAVVAARKQGVQVWSVSIDEEAEQPCNDIYGKKFNVRSDDPNAAISIVKGIF